MPSPKGVKIKLDKNRTLRYTNRALVMLEDETGLTVTGLMERVSAGSIKTINQVVWAGLLHADPDLELVDVYDMIDLAQLETIAGAVGDALGSVFDSAEKDDSGKAEAAAEKS